MTRSESADSVQPIEYWSQLSAQGERSGDYLGACDAALLGLEQYPEARELQYRAILNLSRTGANRRARQLWARYRLQAKLDADASDAKLEENIAALGARLDREEAYSSTAAERPAKLKKAADHYDSIYQRSGSTFLGINAAVLHELSGASDRAKEIAERIVAACAQAKPGTQEDAYQLAADRAAASLLLDDLQDARATIERAADLATNAASIASTRKQLVLICDHKGIDREIIAPLRNRNVIHYTGHMIAPEGAPGRFPAHAEGEVAEKIKAELAAHNVGYGYGSLASGADTLIVEALLDRRAEVETVLPFASDAFQKESVANGGPDWLDRYEKLLKQVGRVVYATDGDYVGDSEVFAYASSLAMGLALLRAQQLSSEVMQLAVWDGRETGEKAGSFADIRAWQSHGFKTVRVDSAGNLRGNGVKAGSATSERRALKSRKVRAIMFGDFHGFSKLSDRQMLLFYDHVMSRVAAVLDRYAGEIATRNTWGDGLFVVFSELGAAARCALEIQSALAELDYQSLGMPVTLGLRLGLDAGAVFEVQDPVLKSLSFTGTHISRTARLEPSTPPGEVYVTQAFAALFTLLEHDELICEYVGMMKAAKDYGRLRVYLLRRRVYSDLAPQDGA
ncbi:MAG: adenylate/guanylate cyclase domain-containing protein [Xanthobacteraceae bacterium]